MSEASAARPARVARAAVLARWLGPVWLTLVVVAVVAFAAREHAQLGPTWAAIRGASAPWLLVLVGMVLAYVALQAETARRIAVALGERVDLGAFVGAQLERQAAAALAPMSGVAGAVAFGNRIVRAGVSRRHAVLIVSTAAAIGYLTFAAFLVPALALLARRHLATPSLWLATAVLAVFVAALLAVVALARHPARAPGWLRRRLPRRLAEAAAEGLPSRLAARDLVVPLACGLVVDAAGVVALYASLAAVGADVTPVTAVAGYAAATLLMLAAPVFAGLGVVELGTIATLGTLGIPSASAAAATLLYRAVQLWLPLALGLAVAAGRDGRARRLAAHVPAAFTGLTGVLALLTVVVPTLPQRLARVEHYAFLTPPALSRTFVAVAGFALILLTHGLWRRRRASWLAAVGLVALSIPAHLLKGHDHFAAVVAAANLGLLLWRRGDFAVRSDVPTLRRGFALLAVALGVALVYGTLGFFVVSRRAFGVEFRLGEAMAVTIRAFFGLGRIGLAPRTHWALWFLDSITVLGVFGIVTAILAIGRPVVWRLAVHPAQRARARRIVAAHGRSALDAFKGADDKLFLFAPHDAGVVAYGQRGGCAVALGDPAAADEATCAALIDAFVDFAEGNGWSVAFHQVPPDHLALYRDRGFATVKLGEEAVVDLAALLARGAPKSVRSRTKTLEREGYRAVFLEPPIADERLARMRAVSEAWLTIGGHRERSFTLGRWDEDTVREGPAMVVEAPDGALVAFATLVPDGVPGETTVDLMRRLPEPNGVMDMLFLRLFEAAHARGYQRFSMGLAPLANVGVGDEANLPERALGLLYAHQDRLFAFRGLYAYKAKFDPEWSPRYLVYRPATALPRVALAVIRLTG